MSLVAAVVFCAVMGALAIFQAALIMGAPWGHLAWGGADRVLPAAKRIGSAVSIVLYGVFVAVVLDDVRLLPVSLEVVRPWAIWVLTAYSGLGVGLNAISRSRTERLVMTPVASVLFVCCLILALD
jgi:hypothetical protein